MGTQWLACVAVTLTETEREREAEREKEREGGMGSEGTERRIERERYADDAPHE